MAWKVARDIGKRMEDLRTALGQISQAELAALAGVYPGQVSNWERGKQRPTRMRLEQWAQRQGWPPEIFAEGGPMPSTVVTRLVTGVVREAPRRRSYEPLEGDPLDFVRDLALNAIRDRERAGEAILYSEATGWVERMYAAGQLAVERAARGRGESAQGHGG